MLKHQRELTLPRLTATPTATSSAYLLTLQFLWRQGQIATDESQRVQDAGLPAATVSALARRGVHTLFAVQSATLAAAHGGAHTRPRDLPPL